MAHKWSWWLPNPYGVFFFRLNKIKECNVSSQATPTGLGTPRGFKVPNTVRGGAQVVMVATSPLPS